MTREEFEIKYAQKYMGLSFVHNCSDAVDAVNQQRNGNGYYDPVINSFWSSQRVINSIEDGLEMPESSKAKIIALLEW